ncbi:MAG TPA: cysteine hydrolase [Candidatus Binatia bacterium]|jgi:ureidoacrylate peracid hydrolase
MIDFGGRSIPGSLAEVVEPARTVLLVWDMQNDQAGGAFNKPALIRNAPPLIAAAAAANIKTVYTRQTPYLWKDESAAWIRRFMIEQKVERPELLKPRRLHASFGWQIMEPFKPGPDDVVIDKRRPTMFIGNEFETVLSNRRATSVVMIGCTTDGGVEATVRDGYYRGYFMIVARDCVGTYTEDGHNAALKRMERFADVVESGELIRLWKSASP